MSLDRDYIELLKDIHLNGEWQEDRTDVGRSKQLFGKTIRFDTKGKYAPFLQCKAFGIKTSFLEFKWMMSGSTDSKWLEERGVGIWKGNTTREFLDSRNLHYLPEGSIGKCYGKQFRDWDCVDQLAKVFNSLRDNPSSRRHVISLWNVSELDEGVLEPCAFLYEFMFQNGKLHLHQHLRSSDVIFGAPYNLGFASFLLFTFAEALGYEAGEILLTLTNAHYYENQVDVVENLIDNWYRGGCIETHPTLSFKKELNTLDDILALEYDDVLVTDWVRGPRTDCNITMAV